MSAGRTADAAPQTMLTPIPSPRRCGAGPLVAPLARLCAGELMRWVKDFVAGIVNIDPLMEIAFEGIGSLSLSKVDAVRKVKAREVQVSWQHGGRATPRQLGVLCPPPSSRLCPSQSLKASSGKPRGWAGRE